MAEESQAEEIAKYKRVLSLARSSLEANQATISAKDQQIAQLIKALEDEKGSNKAKRVLAKEEEAALVPRRILCRVDVEDNVWILLEYEEFDDAWKSFHDQQDLDDFIQRVPGVPLVCPPKCLSAEESERIMDDSKKKVERIVEEFRRYKVRTEIAKKQKDAETRQAVLNGANTASTSSNALNVNSNNTGYNGNISGHLERAMTLGTIEQSLAAGENAMDEVSRLRSMLSEQEAKWKKMYEAVAKENEVLRSKGGESLLATQWRGRYESCMKEKEDLMERLELHTSWTNSVHASGKSMDQAYVELQEEFRAFRKKLAAIDRRKQRNTASIVSAGDDSGTNGIVVGSEIAALLREYETNAANNTVTYNSGSPRYSYGGSSSNGGIRGGVTDAADDADGNAGMTASKIKYVRHMVLQYLSCREAEVRAHMETALMTIFRMTPEEREIIESKRKEETTDALTSLTSFLGSLST